ncbi:MAG TPA: SAM-dependent methyltransferase [Chthonomonadales bacterium]|nr:SAM-dependent methyltransferase [Chthonomonadales bacterium]
MIRLIGLGPGDEEGLSRGAERALRKASEEQSRGGSVLILRTGRHPVAAWLTSEGLQFSTLDHLYDSASDFASLYRSIADAVLEAADSGNVAYAVPGHPLIGEESVRLIRGAAEERGIETEIVASAGFIDLILVAAGLSVDAGIQVRDALSLSLKPFVDQSGNPADDCIDTSLPLLLYQVHDNRSAAEAKLALTRWYPDDWNVTAISHAGVAGRQETVQVPLYMLDRQTPDHLTAVLVPALPPELRKKDFGALVGIMARLRGPGGCPWDREQNRSTLKPYLLEECYEVLEAIDGGDSSQTCEELGDLLLQIVFHAQLAAEED